MSSYDILCYHTAVGSLAGTDAYFRQTANGTNSHFGVGGDGTIYQWVDTAYRSGASYNGNYHLISVETADMGPEFAPWSGSDVPAWTDAQIEANAKIAAWVHAEHGIPLVQIPDALPSRRGVGYHRLGVPGYMVAGAELWSTKVGKACPGDRRIAQIPQVIAAATSGGEGFLMALSDAQQQQLYEAVIGFSGPGRNNFNYLDDKIEKALGVLGDVRSALYGNMPAGQNNFHWAVGTLLTAIAAANSNELTAEAIAAALPDDIANQLAARLAERLAS